MRLDRRALIPIVLLAGLGAAALARADSQTSVVTGDSRTVTVIGLGYQSVGPVTAENGSVNCNVNVNVHGSSLQGVYAELHHAGYILQQKLEALGIPANDVLIQSVGLNGGGVLEGRFGPAPVVKGKGGLPNFNANANMVLDISPSEVPEVLTAVSQLTAEDSELRNVNFNLWLNTQQGLAGGTTVGRSALDEAMAMAGARAKEITTRLGATLGPVEKVEQVDPSGPFGYIGPDRLPVEVRVTYALEG